MALKSILRHDSMHHTRYGAPEKDIIGRRTVKTGLLKAFFAWIARGTSQSAMGRPSCPT